MTEEADPLRWLTTLLPLLFLAGLIYSWRLWRDPSLLRPDSFLYRWVYWRFFSRNRKPADEVKLDDGQIRRYAMLGIVCSIISFALAVWAALAQ